MTPCEGEEDQHDICQHLLIESEERTICKWIQDNEKDNPFLGSGCVLRSHEGVIEAYKEILADQGKTLSNIRRMRNDGGI